MQLRARALIFAISASAAVSVSAQAQDASATTPPPAAAAPATPPDAATTSTNAAADTGVAGGPSADRKAAGEDIVVTGSRVRRKDLTTPAPVTVISREQIVSSGIASIGDFLQQIPEQGGALNTNVNNGGDGETAISLRNLGAARTLVLVDGKRWVNGGSGAGSFVDLNSIPTAAIERVEVLKDGASAVYGSDAIGGVVNIITRRRVNGVEAQAYGGESPHGDAQQYDLSITGGATSDKGSFMFNAEYFNQQAMFAGNRDWAKTAVAYDYTVPPGTAGQVTTSGSGTIPSGRATVDLNACNGNALCNSLAATFSGALKCKPGASCVVGVRPDTTTAACGAGALAVGTDLTKCNVDGWRPVVSSGANNDLYNFQAVNYLVTPSTRMSLFSNGDFHISNSARAYFQGSYLNRQSGVQLASEPLSTGAFGVQIPIDNVYNPFGDSTNPACHPLANGDAPPGCGQAVSAARRLTDAGGRTTAFDLNTIRAVVGMDGTLPEEFGPLQGLFWDVSFNYGRTQGTTTFGGSVNTGATANALGATFPGAGTSTGFGCGPNSGSAINGCTPANLFGASLTPDMLSSLGFYTGINSGFTQLASTQANISAELFKLAADRPIGLAAGYEYRAEYGGFQPDPIGAAQQSFDFNSFPTKGSYHVNEGYAELDIPVISNVPGAEDLEIQAALRVFNYSTFGSDFTYKLGARWRPIRDLTVRGTYSTGFRAPDVSNLYGGAAPAAEVATDPCGNKNLDPRTSALGARCAQQGPLQGVTRLNSGGFNKAAANGDTSVQLNSTVGGNSLLQPEKANIATVGLVFEPSMLRGLSATVDYYNIKVTSDISSITAPVILNGCYNEGNDAYCKLVTRDPTSGQISNINDFLTNVGVIQTSGFDFAVRYGFPTDFGRFGLVFDSNYLIYERQSFGDGTLLETAGNYDFGSGSPVGSLTPKLKFNVGLNYALAGFSAGLRARYIGGFDECAGTDGSSDGGGFCSPDQRTDANGEIAKTSGAAPLAAHHVPAYVTFDLGLSYLLKTSFGSTTFSAGMRNILDKNPPFVYNETFIFTDPGYDLVGRFVYGRIAQSF
jgi:iron complex outermembrane receptor protein